MFGLRSARGRAILAGTVFVLLLVSIAALAVWRTNDMQQRHRELDYVSAAATAIEGTQAQFWLAQAALSALVISGDVTWVDDYDTAMATADQDLAKARAEFLAMGEADKVAALDDLTGRIDEFNQTVRWLFPTIIEGDRQSVLDLANSSMSQMTAANRATIADLEKLVRQVQLQASTELKAADNAADSTLWMLLSLSGVALATGVVTVVGFLRSVVGPLATLRASARAITSGNPDARARVFGPEEVASLARDFNEMNDSLAAKALALQEGEKRYRLIADNATDLIWTMDMGLHYTYISPSVQRLRGYSVEEAMARTVDQDLCPSSLDAAMKTLTKELARHGVGEKDLARPRTLELEHFCKDGSTIWLEVTTAFLRGDDGQPVGLLGVSRDIAERKQAQKEQEESERRYRLLADNASDIIWTMDMNLRFTYESPSVTRIRGYTPEEAMTLTMEETLTPASLEVGTKALAEELALEGADQRDSSRSRTLELEHTCKDGSTVWLEVTTTFLRDENGRAVGLLGASRDISERRRAEQELEESRRLLENVTKGITEGILLLSRDLEILWANDAIAEQTGYEMAQILGSPCYRVTHHRETPCGGRLDPCPIRKVLETGKPVVVTHIHLNAAGEEIPIEVTVYPVRDEQGEIVQFVHMSRDVSERKRAEDERERLHAALEARAITDGLTGLHNHVHFYQRLAEEMERCQRYDDRFAVAMMDVDNFKKFNDSRGHQEGDKMLRLVADSIRSGLRGTDLAFRYGGDEFAAILLHADAARAATVMERIKRRLAKGLKQMNDGAASCLSLSAGVACFGDDGRTVDELVRVADAALYSAKWATRARYATSQECAIEALAAPPAMAARGMLSTTAGSLAAALRELGVPDAIAELNLRTIAALGTLAEIKDPYVRGHQERTSDVAATLAEELGLSPDRVRGTRLAGLVHDLGKAGVSKSILRKPGKLTEEEFAEIKEHPPLGSMMIISEVEALQQLVPIVRHHHERFDGKGYPDGLAGEDIPLEARILAVVDAFDAMTHERSYRKAMSREEALVEIERGAGTQFDPAVVEVFLAWAAKEGEDLPARRQDDNELAAAPTTKA